MKHNLYPLVFQQTVAKYYIDIFNEKLRHFSCQLCRTHAQKSVKARLFWISEQHNVERDGGMYTSFIENAVNI
jgi:hypothetical protein